MASPAYLSFQLPDHLVEPYATRRVPWGFGILSEITFLDKYSRTDNPRCYGEKERWHHTCRRVVEGMYSIQKDWCLEHKLPWIEEKAVRSAMEAFDRLFTFKWTPPGRGLWMMGTGFVHAQRNSAPLQNCSFVSTSDILQSMAFLMEGSMLGIGVGFNLDAADAERAAGGGYVIGDGDRDRKSLTAVFPSSPSLRWVGDSDSDRPFDLWDTTWEEVVRGREADQAWVIEDTREGWVESTVHLLRSYLDNGRDVTFIYDGIRPAGIPIKGFGGIAAGPAPLIDLHNRLRQIFDGRAGERLTATDVADIGNLIGDCVVAGNVRRSAEILLGPPTPEFLALKDPEVNPERNDWSTGWGHLSNNSVYAAVGETDYTAIAELNRRLAEPGLFYLKLAQDYGRMIDPPNHADWRVAGTNPCGEQSLESYECCTLVETYPTLAESKDDYLRSLKFAYLYAKSVTLLPTHWEETNAIMQRNRRIGTSMTGLAQFVDSGHTVTELWRWQDEGYQTIRRWDEIYSEWLCVRESVKVTSVKPSGTVSLLAGVTPGAHWPTHSVYLRRMRLQKDNPIVEVCRAAGYHVEPEIKDPENTVVVEFPVKLAGGVRVESEVSIWEKVALVAGTQRYWADNQVSATATFRKDEADDVAAVLRSHEGQLKSISLMPIFEANEAAAAGYGQLPYEAIDELAYARRTADIREVDTARLYVGTVQEANGERYCSNDTCELPA